LGERLLCKQEVDGSIPFTSTTAPRREAPWSRAASAAFAECGGSGLRRGSADDRCDRIG
jgi:hypothetical protein